MKIMLTWGKECETKYKLVGMSEKVRAYIAEVINKSMEKFSLEESDNIFASSERIISPMQSKESQNFTFSKPTTASVHNDNNNSTPSASGCYIATAVYGSYDCPEVWTLRRYRDEVLYKKILGHIFIKLYYSISPTVVKLFGKNKFFKSFWKRILDKKTKKLHDKGFANNAYDDKY